MRVKVVIDSGILTITIVGQLIFRCHEQVAQRKQTKATIVGQSQTATLIINIVQQSSLVYIV